MFRKELRTDEVQGEPFVPFSLSGEEGWLLLADHVETEGDEGPKVPGLRRTRPEAAFWLTLIYLDPRFHNA